MRDEIFLLSYERRVIESKNLTNLPNVVYRVSVQNLRKIIIARKYGSLYRILSLL